MNDNNFYRQRDEIKLRKEKRENEYKKDSAERLKTIIGKKYLTVAVGALDSFEKAFGWLWGHGLEEHELTEEQKDYQALWDRVRTEILDRGNSNKRACFDEIGQYTISWNRYTTTFSVNGRKGNG